VLRLPLSLFFHLENPRLRRERHKLIVFGASVFGAYHAGAVQKIEETPDEI
jgi:hypothetical protein